MNALRLSHAERGHWSVAGAVALVGHVAVAVMVLGWARLPEPPLPDPVVLVELPPMGSPEIAASEAQQQVVEQQAAPTSTPLPIDVPPTRLPVPANAVTLPAPTPAQPVRQAAPAAAPAALPVATAPVSTGSPTATGSDPRAKKQEADYFALVSAHLNRRKVYPAEAKQARQQGIVTVRFTVDRSGSVSGVSINGPRPRGGHSFGRHLQPFQPPDRSTPRAGFGYCRRHSAPRIA